MTIIHGWQGKRKPRDYEGKFPTYQTDTPTRPQHGSGESGGELIKNSSDVRSRLGRPSAVEESAEQKTYYVPWDTTHACGMSKQEYDAAMLKDKQRKEAAARAEQQRRDDEVRKRREQWRREEDAKLLKVERERQSKAVEQRLVQSQITTVLDGMGASQQERAELTRRLTAQGLAGVPDVYTFELRQLRAGK